MHIGRELEKDPVLDELHAAGDAARVSRDVGLLSVRQLQFPEAEVR